MTRPARARTRWCLVVVFAIGMAWVEAASVYYLRAVVDRIEPYQENPLPIHRVLGPVEIVREAATLVMLLTVGMLTGRTWPRRLGYTAIAFGVWDILYYVFLKIICDWPKSLFDWDILFLLPLPWWGPVLAPVCIASLMVVWGTLVTQFTDGRLATSKVWSLSWLGMALALYVFMADSLRAVSQGLDVRHVLPTSFNWPAFCVALMFMAIPVAQMGWRTLNQTALKPTVDSGHNSERLRDHGVTPQYVRPLKNGGQGRPSVDELIELRDRGVTRDRIRAFGHILDVHVRAMLNGLAYLWPK